MMVFKALNINIIYLQDQDLLAINHDYINQVINKIYPTELQFNEAYSSDTKAEDFGFKKSNFEIVNFLCLNSGIPQTTSYINIFAFASISCKV